MNEYDRNEYLDITRNMSDVQRRQFALVIARRALNIFEDVLPNDNRPRKIYELALEFFPDNKPIPKKRWSAIYSNREEVMDIYRGSKIAQTAALTVAYLGIMESLPYLVLESSSVCLAAVFNSSFSRYDNVEELRDEFNIWLYKEARKIIEDS